jgi:hypothetical protein
LEGANKDNVFGRGPRWVTPLDVIGGVVLTTGFVLSTATFAVAIGASSAVPRAIRRCLESSAEGQGLAPGGRTWVALTFFGVFAMGIVVAQLAFLFRQASGGSDRALVSVAALVVEAAWLALLVLRRSPQWR